MRSQRSLTPMARTGSLRIETISLPYMQVGCDVGQSSTKWPRTWYLKHWLGPPITTIFKAWMIPSQSNEIFCGTSWLVELQLWWKFRCLYWRWCGEVCSKDGTKLFKSTPALKTEEAIMKKKYWSDTLGHEVHLSSKLKGWNRCTKGPNKKPNWDGERKAYCHRESGITLKKAHWEINPSPT